MYTLQLGLFRALTLLRVHRGAAVAIQQLRKQQTQQATAHAPLGQLLVQASYTPKWGE
jgi:hypothetical protein